MAEDLARSEYPAMLVSRATTEMQRRRREKGVSPMDCGLEGDGWVLRQFD